MSERLFMNDNKQRKNLGLIVIISVTIFVLVAFIIFKLFKGKNSSSSSGSSQLISSTVSPAKSKLAKIFAQKSYSLTYRIFDQENNVSFVVLFVRDGDKMFSRYTYDNLPDQQSSIIIIGDDYYSIDHANKTIYHNQAAAEENNFDLIDSNYQDEVLVAGQETIDNVTYDTEDFGDGNVFYFLGDQLKMIKEKENNTTIIVENYSSNIDQSLFVLPSDYKIQEEMEIDSVSINDDQITAGDLEELKARGIDVNLDELDQN